MMKYPCPVISLSKTSAYTETVVKVQYITNLQNTNNIHISRHFIAYYCVIHTKVNWIMYNGNVLTSAAFLHGTTSLRTNFEIHGISVD